ncbi:MAG: glycosyltransferase [Myxococcota bacterium]
MKLLLISPRSPWPPRMADAMTMDKMVRFLAARGHDVDLFTYVESDADASALRNELGGVCRTIETVCIATWRSYLNTAWTLPGRLPMAVQYYRSPEMNRLVEDWVARGAGDLVYAHSIRTAEPVRHLDIPKVLGMQISQALNLGRMVELTSDPLRKIFYTLECLKVRPYEAKLCADFDRVALCGPADIAEIEKTEPFPNAVICPHGQDVPPLSRVRDAPREPGAIVLSGVMSTYTNVDAAIWFANEVFPRVEAEVPQAQFWIVGRDPQRGVRELAQRPRITVTGEVPDVYDWLCRAEVGVTPTRIAAGMQNKLVQAMACELPVVATSQANEGIRGTDGEHLFVSDDPAVMAERIIGLLRDAAGRERLGRAARSFVEAHWTWEVNFEKFEQLLRDVAGASDKVSD